MKDKELNFEKALADLDGIVEKLEKGGLSLSESLALFEKGVKLARFLRTELDKAEKKIEILLKDEKGNVRGEPFGLEDEASEGGAEDEGNEKEPDFKGKAAPGKKKPDDEDEGELPF